MMRQSFAIAAACAALASARPVVAQAIFSDSLSSGVNWTVVMDADSSAEFGYDYSLKGIPPAPNGTDTIGLKFEVNNNAPADINHITALNTNAAYTGQYTLRADVWINWALVGGGVGAGTTEFAGLSVGHDGLGPGPWGASMIFDGDGDSANSDYRLYKDLTVQATATGQYATGTAANANDNTNPAYATAFPSIDVATAVPTQGQTGATAAGAGGFQWMTVNVEVDTTAVGPSGGSADPGFARFSLRSAATGATVTVGTVDNSSGGFVVNMKDSIALVMSDIFTSVTVNPAFSFAIFDNVTVLPGLVPLATPGDYNADGDVDGRDFLIWQRGGSPTPLSAGDLADWQTNYGATAIAAAVPEPASAALVLLAAAAGLLPPRRRHDF